MNREDRTGLVQEHEGRFIVAYWDERNLEWKAPIRSTLRRGPDDHHTAFARRLSSLVPYAYTYARRSDALRRARQLYGEV